jgi:hypothetical protein
MSICSEGHSNPESFRFCATCGELLTRTTASSSVPPPPGAAIPKRSMSRVKKIIWIVGISVIGVSVIGAIFGEPAENQNSQKQAASSLRTMPPVATDPDGWIPPGFEKLKDRLAYRWLESNEYKCSSFADGCWGLLVYSHDGCGSLYVELGLLDSSGVNVGMTNDIASNVRAGEQAKLEFEDYGNGASRARIAQVNCY